MSLLQRMKNKVKEAFGIVAAEDDETMGWPGVPHMEGATQWHQNGKLHREDGPAVEIVENGVSKKFSGAEWAAHQQEQRQQAVAVQVAAIHEGLSGSMTAMRPLSFKPSASRTAA
jgi:hypothetical protein